MTVGPPSTLAAGSSFLLEWALTSQPETAVLETAVRALTAEVRHLELELTRRLEHEQQRAAVTAEAAVTAVTAVTRSEPEGAHEGAHSAAEGAHEGAQSAARQRLLAALQRLVRMLPSAANASAPSPNGGAVVGVDAIVGVDAVVGGANASAPSPNGGAAAEAAPAPAAASASRERREEALVAEALEGALRAQKIFRDKVEECRRLRASMRRSPVVTNPARSSDRSGLVTTGFRFDDRVAFVRRASVPRGSAPGGSVAAVGAVLGALGQPVAAGGKAAEPHSVPLYVALREGAAGPLPPFSGGRLSACRCSPRRALASPHR